MTIQDKIDSIMNTNVQIEFSCNSDKKTIHAWFMVTQIYVEIMYK